MAAIELEELLKEVGVRVENLNEPISDNHLHEIASFLTSWQTVASKLCLNEIDQDTIEREGKSEEDKKRKMLQKWKGIFAFKATYRMLVEALLSLAKADVAEKVCRLLKETADTGKEAQKHEQDTELHHKQFRFSGMKQDLVQNINFLEKIFDEQNTEIKKLQEELQKKKHQLQSVQQEAQAIQKMLHDKVEYLQKEKDKLMMSCKAEKEEALQQRRHVSALLKELEEAEMQKRQALLEKEAAIQELEAKKIEMQFRPKVTDHPESQRDVIPGKPVMFTIQAFGSEPLSYQWQHKTWEGSEGWQSCDEKRFQGAKSSTLITPSVQKSDEGTYHCIVSNCAGSETSEYGILTVAEPPRVITHPQEIKNAIPGNVATINIETTGTEPLYYQWQHKTGDGGWLSCDVERFPGANSSTLTILSVHKSNEGGYRCIVSNSAGSETSEFGTVTVAEPPRITTHPKDLKDAVPGKPVTFTVQATGTEPLSYQWQWKEGSRGEEWQLCDLENFSGANSSKLVIFQTTMWAYYKGSYRCIISNCAGSQTSEAASFTFDTYQQLSKQLPSSFPAKPAQPVVKAFVVGDPGAGKSTLTKALQTENRGLSYIANRVLKVTGVDQKTAGIVPHDVESKKFGRLTLYDFAGQKEFYASHDAVLRSAVSHPTAAVFLIVADLRASDKEFTERIQYWLAFLENQRVSAVTKPHLIIIASHADQVRGAEIEGKRRIVESLQQSPAFSDFHYAGFVAMDCRYSRSSSMSQLRQYLAKSCDEIRSTVEMSDRSQFFLVYLQSKFRDCPAVQLSQISAAIANECEEDPMFGPLVACIPYEIRSDLSQVCDELNGRGNILFLKSSLSSESSWIILNCEALLSVTGTIFAPEDFRQHQDLATSTGVVPFTRIVRHLPPDLDPSMIVDFLCHFEFCHKIADKVLSILLQNQFTEADAISFDGSTDDFYFFPGLVSIEVPSGVWEGGAMCDYHCGWVLQCNRSGQFFTPRFVQVLLLRLAFSFTELAPKGSNSLPSLQTRCSLWKSGICWENRHGVETLVEVGEGSRRVAVMWRCPKDREVECANQRSDIICKVLQAREEFCPKVTLSESYLRPSDSKEYPPKPSSELALINMVEVANAITEAKPCVKDSNGNVIALTELLGFEPYAYLGQHIVKEIFDEHKTQERISDEFLHRIADKNYHEFDQFKKMLEISTASADFPATQIPSGEMAHLLLSWREKSEGSRQCLHQKLNQFSVFAGRNPLDLENSQVSVTST